MRHARRNLTLLATCQAFMLTCNSLMIAVAGLIGYELAESKWLATLPIALAHLSTMVTTYPASLLMARIGRKAGFLLAGCIGLVGTLIAIYAIVNHNFLMFCVSSIGFGSFTAFGHYYRFTAAEVVEPDYKSRAISWVMAGGVVAALAGPNLANVSQDWIEGARFAGCYLALVAVYGASIVAIAFTVLPAPVREDIQTPGRPLSEIMAQPRFVVAVTCATLGYAIMALIMTATPLAMHHHTHTFSDVAFVIQWHVLGMFVPSFFTGHLIRRYGCIPVMLVGGICGVVCVAINLSGISSWHFWAALVLLGIAWNFLYIGGTTMLTDTYQPNEKARVQGINDVVVFSTVTVAALSAGALHHNLGWETVNLGVTPGLLVVFVSLIALSLRERRLASAS
ncbi:MAG: MFS transporter [Pseudomonadota bacterium]